MILSTEPTRPWRSTQLTFCDWATTSDSVTESFSPFWVDQILKVTSVQPMNSITSIGASSANSMAETPRSFRQSFRRRFSMAASLVGLVLHDGIGHQVDSAAAIADHLADQRSHDLPGVHDLVDDDVAGRAEAVRAVFEPVAVDVRPLAGIVEIAVAVLVVENVGRVETLEVVV